MTIECLSNPDHWRKRGDEMRTAVKEWNRPEARAVMFRMAADDDRLAEQGRTASQTAQSLPKRRR